EKEIRKRIGVLHEKPVYPLNVSVIKLLRFIGKLKDVSISDIKRIISLVGLNEYIDRRISTLSRGYLQRLGLAIALIGDPEVLILDEPTANLDPAARGEILNLLQILKEDLNVTMIIASHIVSELEKICSDAVFINEGVVLSYGKLSDLAMKFNVETKIRITSDMPRKVASEIILNQKVKSIEIREKELIIWTDNINENLISELYSIKGVKDIEIVSASLYSLYRRVVLGE
ncbi:MAG: hypothetical protein DRN81_07310, partial [Thermoproteota archaeon]